MATIAAPPIAPTEPGMVTPPLVPGGTGRPVLRSRGALPLQVPTAVAHVSDADAARLKVRDDGYVRVASRTGEVFLKARVTGEVPEGMLFVPAHFPHARVNALTTPSANGGPHMSAVKVEPAG